MTIQQPTTTRTQRWTTRLDTTLRRPLALTILGVALVGLLALLYVYEVAGVASANEQLRTLRAEQTRLDRQDAEAHAQLGTVTSPAYIDRRARQMGLLPSADDTPPSVIVVPTPRATGGQP